MDWREPKAAGCEEVFSEAQRWMEEVTKKRFGSSNFRSSLENGVLLCDLINKLKPGLIKRVNRLCTPIAGLDNVNVFLKACGKLGLNDAQLFHPGDLQDVSTRVTVRRQETSRRLKNVLITIYWLGRKAQADPTYNGPQLNFKAFEGLLGVTLSKALEEASYSKSSVRYSDFAETWYPDKEVPSYRREDSVESLDSVESHAQSVTSDWIGSDAEAEHCFRMMEPGRGRQNVAALRRKKAEQHEGPLLRVPPGRPVCIGSKSMSDITPEPNAQESESNTMRFFSHRNEKATIVSRRQEQMRQCQARLRESEAVWQEDLNKWKTRRKSLNSDLHKKNAREQLKPSTSGTVHVGEEEQQRSLEREEPDLASVAPDEAFMQPSPSRSSSSAPDTQATSEAIQRTVSLNSTSSDHMQSSSSPSLPATASDSVPAPVQCARSSEGVVSEAPQMSAVLPRGLRRSEGTSRLSTGVTPKPFSIKTAGRLTQPRFYSMDDFQNSQREHQLPTSFPHQGSDTTSGYKDDLRSGAREAIQESKGETSGKRIDSAPTIHSFMSASILMPDKVGHHDMKVSLCQTPDGGKDFGFQAYWDSTGTCIKSVQPGSPAQLCHLRAGDEIVALGGQRVAEMSYEQWKANMDAALREGKLLMEIRRLGLNGDPDHQESISTTSTLPENEAKMQVNGHPVNANGLSLKAVSGLLPDNQFPRKTKEQDIIVMQNHNRRLDFFKQKGGSDSAISDLQVPSIGVSSSRWSWNAEEERRRQEKWQMEQEHLLQEKYRRDQERLEEAWRRDQQEAALEESLCLEKQELPSLPSGNRTHYTPPPVLQQAKSPTSVAPPPQTKEATLTQKKPVQVLAGHPSRKACDSSTETSQWKKSKSSSSLEGRPKQDSRGIKKKSRVSQAEQERLQILEEMRKKTPVLTDSSWIRQHSTSTIHKGPINMEPIKRHESLDNIHSASDNTISNSSLSKHFSSSSFPLSGLSGIVPYRGYSGRCSLGPGAAIFSNALKQNSWSQPTSVSPVSDPEEACNRTQQHDSVSAAGLSSGKTQNQEPRCESDTDSSSATPVTTDSESILAFPSDRSASWNIGEKRFPEEDSNTVNTSSAQRNV